VRRAAARVGLASAALAAAVAAAGDGGPERPEVAFGSKNFTESVVLGELARGLAEDAGAVTRHRRGLGGTTLVFNALVAGDVDVYADYTGTLLFEVFAEEGPRDVAELDALLAERGVRRTRPLGFANDYALGMLEPRAAELGIASISDLRAHPGLVLRFSTEFMERADGWGPLREHYGLPRMDALGVEHELAYRGLASGDVDVTDVYTTDAKIAHYGLRTLADDRGFFPSYEAVLLYRADLARRAPEVVAALERLEGAIDARTMSALNGRVQLDGVDERAAAADFLAERLGVSVAATSSTRLERLGRRTREHLALVAVSLALAIACAIPLGVWAARRPRAGQLVLGVVGVAQTVPALALLVFMIPLFGIGTAPAVVALFLYSLLPIVRNTHAGLTGIPASLRESAEALGLPAGARLRRVELPLATPSILAGIKTAAVIDVGAATLGALIGAGGYGQPILTGIRLDDAGLILEGAVPAAVLALLVQGSFDLAERRLVSRGLRVRPAGGRSS